MVVKFIPLFFTYVVMVVVVLISIGIGFKLGEKTRKSQKDRKKTSLGSIIGAMLALLAFILALTYSMVSTRYAARKELVLDEANAIGTAILRTDFLEEPIGAESRKLLKEYVSVKAQYDANIKNLPTLLEDSLTIQEQLWFLAVKSKQSENPVLFALYIESLNEVIDIHALRYAQGIQYRLPSGIWFLLYFVSVLAMLAVGYEFGINDSGNILGALLLALMFSAVVLLISDLDKAAQSVLVKVSQEPIIELDKMLNSSDP